MAEIQYTDKSQTAPYDAAKINAQDMNEIKSVVNANAAATPTFVPCIVFIGESNSGGYALNSDATLTELSSRPAVQILNNDTFVFQNLKIGDPNSNNLIDHFGLSPANSGVVHSWELGLANQVTAGDWPTSVVYLLKCGQGGSYIAQWNDNDTYMDKFTERVDAAKAYFASIGAIPLFYIWFSFGINDAIDGDDVATFKPGVKNWWARIREVLGFAPIMYTELMSIYASYTAALDELAAEDGYAFKIETSDAPLRDTNHWNYVGQKLISSRMTDVSVNTIGYGLQYILSQSLGLSRRSVSSDPTPGPDLNWSLFQNCSANVSTNALEFTTGSPAGATGSEIINADSDFEYIIKYNDALGKSGMVVLLEDAPGTPYTWATSSDPFVSGVYCVFGDIMRTTQRNTGTVVTTTASNDTWFKVYRVGDDVQYDVSTDSGGVWAPCFTHVGVLLGLTGLYLKCIFAVTDDGAKTVLVERVA